MTLPLIGRPRRPVSRPAQKVRPKSDRLIFSMASLVYLIRLHGSLGLVELSGRQCRADTKKSFSHALVFHEHFLSACIWGIFALLVNSGQFAFAVSAAAAPETCSGNKAVPVSVMRCYDGDTCTLSDKTKIRLAGIDAPEKKGTMGGKGQTGSDLAAAALREKLVGKQGVSMISHDVDRYGRKVGEFCIGGKSVNVEMVREGYAMKFKGKVRTKTIDNASLERAESEAKAAGKGIWSSSAHAQDPGEYRRQLREAKENYGSSDLKEETKP